MNFSRDHNAFFLYSNRGEANASDYRVAFGNAPLPVYATRGLLANQFILTKRSVPDSDALHFFQPTFFVSPDRRVADIFRLNISYDLKNEKIRGLLVYNVAMIKTKRGDGILFSQNVNHEDGKNQYGLGIGYKFGKFGMAPIIRFPIKNNRKVVIEFSLNY